MGQWTECAGRVGDGMVDFGTRWATDVLSDRVAQGLSTPPTATSGNRAP